MRAIPLCHGIQKVYVDILRCVITFVFCVLVSVHISICMYLYVVYEKVNVKNLTYIRTYVVIEKECSTERVPRMSNTRGTLIQ